jgi:hypothetical protein
MSEILRLVVTAILASLVFRGCHEITGYVADPTIATRPHIMYRYPWLGNLTGALSFLVFLLVPFNGWIIWRWQGLIGITLFWWIVTNPVASFLTGYRSTFVTSNPFLHVIVGMAFLIGITMLNLVLA